MAGKAHPSVFVVLGLEVGLGLVDELSRLLAENSNAYPIMLWGGVLKTGYVVLGPARTLTDLA